MWRQHALNWQPALRPTAAGCGGGGGPSRHVHVIEHCVAFVLLQCVLPAVLGNVASCVQLCAAYRQACLRRLLGCLQEVWWAVTDQTQRVVLLRFRVRAVVAACAA